MELEIREFSTADTDFDLQMQDLLARGLEFDPEIDSAVAEIIQSVRQRGDQALLEYTRKFDRNFAATVADLEVSLDERERARDRVSWAVNDALEDAFARIYDFHKRQLKEEHDPWFYEDANGSYFGQYSKPIERVGVYIPGGRAAYPSSVLMTVIPAIIAGVNEIIMVVPAPDGRVNDSVLSAAELAGADRVFKIGGAQAIAALAFGTETVPKVDKVVGPGNAWVSAAKRQVFGHVGIDMVAGPSEVVVACDESAPAEWVAMDMFAQAEHDESAQSILVSVSPSKIDEVRAAMSAKLPVMERKDIIARSLARQGAMIHVRNDSEMADVINLIAPEHLGLMMNDPDPVFDLIEHAGSIFIGHYSTEVFGDYCAGPNHVLPTSGAARFSSPLGVYDFRKRTSFIECDPATARKLASISGELAREERLTAHARAADCRKS